MIKNGFLQQNAFDPVDMYSVPEKQVIILRLIMDFYNRALRIIRAGAPLLKLRSLSVIERIVRMKSQIPNENLELVQEVKSLLDRELGDLEKEYKV